LASALGLFVFRPTGVEKSAEAAAADSSREGLPEKFTAVDTSRVLGSPDPLPLEKVRVFPKLTFERPVELTHARDGSGRLFVLEQKGVIRVFPNDNGAAEAGVFLDLRDVVLSEGNEEGLLGLAFHPKYAENGKFYVYYTTKPRSSVIACYRVSADDPNKADRASEQRILQIPQPFANHNGGSIQFGPDGCLYIGMGDGGSRDDPYGNAQNLGSLLGKILRIDVDNRDGELAYAVPKDNPFVGRDGARGEVWAYGLRNPWRISFDTKTGDLWTGDVGQDRFEEVDRIECGGNYGWNIREGAHDFYPETPGYDAKLIDPVAEYFHGEGISVTGGGVYRGAELPDFDGAYFYGDYASGNVWTVRLDERGRPVGKRQVARTELSIAAFGVDQAGEMYLCSFDGGIYRLRPTAGDRKAVADAFPKKLSETGFFTSVAKNEVAPGVLPYEINVPFWSDYAVKDRYVALPAGGKVRFDAREKWEFPVGTVFIKTFWMHQDRANWSDARRLETRLLVNTAEGWNGYTYRYDDDQQEAYLVPAEGERLNLSIKTDAGEVRQSYYLPSRADCLSCHTKQEGFVLGLNTRQMNRELKYHGESEQQLALWNRLGLFTDKLADDAAKLDRYPPWTFGNWDRSGGEEKTPASGPPQVPEGDTTTLARTWLDVNCAMCHRPQGIAPGGGDLRFHTATEKMNFVDKPQAEPRRRLKGTALIKPGEPERSELLQRVELRGVRQMPPLATNLIDPTGTSVLRRWIAEMKAEKRAEGGGGKAE
jgi:uncharacterized repeat protein (TIGR03806 family)